MIEFKYPNKMSEAMAARLYYFLDNELPEGHVLDDGSNLQSVRDAMIVALTANLVSLGYERDCEQVMASGVIPDKAPEMSFTTAQVAHSGQQFGLYRRAGKSVDQSDPRQKFGVDSETIYVEINVPHDAPPF